MDSLTGILRAGQSEAAAQCESELLHGSEMSDEGVMKIAIGVGSNTAMDDDFDLDEVASDLSDHDRTAFRKIAEEFTRCMD